MRSTWGYCKGKRGESRAETAESVLPPDDVKPQAKALPLFLLSTFYRSTPLLKRLVFDRPFQSGRLDLNQRPLRPERSALTKLSYAP